MIPEYIIIITIVYIILFKWDKTNRFEQSNNLDLQSLKITPWNSFLPLV